MKIISVPSISKIIAEPEERFYKGYYHKNGRFYKKNVKTQATLPDDENLLEKLSLKPNEKVLFIAGYYGNWAKALAKYGINVYYSDVSKNLVDWARKSLKERNIKRYFVSDYTLIPSKKMEYDWTFSFEPIGAKQGLPIAMLRSLLNKGGGKLVVYPRLMAQGGINHYKSSRPLTDIIKLLSRIYNTKYRIERKLISGKTQNGEMTIKNHVIITIFSNNLARKNAEFDLKILNIVKNKKYMDLLETSKNINSSEEEIKQSLKRIKSLKGVIKDNFFRKVVLK
jgi:hypothetical protein